MKADLAYFDPPYATEFSTTNYEQAYHFVEGLMTYWNGLRSRPTRRSSTTRSTTRRSPRPMPSEFFQTFLGNAKHIRHWLISYRDHAYPNEEQMKKIIGSLGAKAG